MARRQPGVTATPTQIAVLPSASLFAHPILFLQMQIG
jgi:hypothetical protein